MSRHIADHAQLLAELRTARALEDRAKLNALAPPAKRGPRRRFVQWCERILGIR